ncbi:ExeA family protein [Hydrogenophaga sp.]|uniref:ExeA family protein n=1 Tax=Hydrogenophaga sp. TaxID=1904254 RepID=UPI0035B24ADB
MYAEYFGLQQEPFSIAPDPRFLFMSERHREALAHLLYGVRGGGGFVLLTGEIGAGKTTICRCFLEQLPEPCRVAYLFNPKLTVGDLLRSICQEFQIEVKAPGPGPATIKDHLDPLNDHLLRSHAQGLRNVLVIDEAQNLSPHVLEQLRLLTNLETNEHKLLQVILIGQPELRGLVARPELEQLAQRIVARYHLDALTPAETRQYIQHRLDVAGLKGPLPFSDAAIQRVHALTAGVPRRINLLCDRALLGTYATGQARVERATVDKAAQEVFDTPTKGPAETGPSPLPERALYLGLGAAAGAVLVAGAAWAWWQGQRPVAAPATPVASLAPESSAAAAQAPANAPAAEPQAPPPPKAPPTPEAPAATPGLPPGSALIASADAAWAELSTLWGTPLSGAAPCNQAPRQGVQCYRTQRMTLHGLRQLDRPAVLDLQLPDRSRGRVLLTAMSADAAWLQAGGQRWQLPLTQLADAWDGSYETLWRLPPGLRARVADARQTAAATWVGERIAALQAKGTVPSSAAQLTARVQAFQRSQGIDAEGVAGPITLMQLNLASGVDEPRLSAPRS